MHLYDAFANRGGIESPHFFMYKTRSALSPEQLQMITDPKEITGDPRYVFALVKNFLADSEFSQAPVLVLPASHSAKMQAQPEGTQSVAFE